MHTKEDIPMAVRVTSRIKEWTRETERKADRAMLALATTIHRDAGNLAPVDTGALAASGRVRRNSSGNYSIVFGGSAVPYAKLRHYKNRKNPQTLKYLERAGDANSRNFKRYMKGL